MGAYATAELVLLFTLWNFFSVTANIACKQYLSAAHSPVTLTLVQYLSGAVIVYAIQRFVPSTATPTTVAPAASFKYRVLLYSLCAVNGIGHLLTNMSMGSVAVSFTHTVKAAEPFFSVVLSFVFLGEVVTPYIVGSLVPIVLGIVLATTSELTYDHYGFMAAMGSNFVFSARNIISKKMQTSYEINNFTMFLQLSCAGLMMMLPLFVLWTDDVSSVLVGVTDNQETYLMVLLKAGVSHCIYNLVSFIILARVSPVAHAIGNAMKRVVVVVSAVLWFGTVVSAMNVAGMAMALGGVGCYTAAKSAAKRVPAPPKHTDKCFVCGEVGHSGRECTQIV